MATPFVGRIAELEALNSLLPLEQSKLVAMKGRRRIGKSRLVEEFAKNKIYLPFTGKVPDPETTRQSQLDTFSHQLAENFQLPLTLFSK